MLQLTQLNHLPADFMQIKDIRQLHQVFSQPTLMTLSGKISQPLFVSVLLHANEPTGFFAIQALLKKYQNKPLPRTLMIFIGNIEASKAGVRRLPEQPDYNRVWPGGPYENTPEGQLMQQVIEIAAAAQPFASIDIHNNTGKNPHYGCINLQTPEFLQLAALFSHTVVYFESPKGVQSMAMAKICPAITLECGKPDEAHGVEHARDYVDTIMHLESLSTQQNLKNEISVYQTVVRLLVPPEVEFDFQTEQNPSSTTTPNGDAVDISFELNFDKLNFSELATGHVFASIQGNRHTSLPIIALDDNNQDVTAQFFEQKSGYLVLKQTVMPAMITLNKEVIRQDCLCYLMVPRKIDSV